MKCEDEATLSIDVGWPKKKHQETAAQERWEEKFSWMLFGWDIDSFLPCSVSLLFHISLPHLFWKCLAEPFFNECVKPLGERFMFNDCDHT